MRRGFTLIELVLVLLVLAVMTATVVPSIGKSIETSELKKDSATLLSLLRQARVLAAVQGTRTRVVVETGRARLERLEDPEADLGTYVAADGPLGRPVALEEPVRVTLTNRETGEVMNEVVFYPDGTADPVDIELRHDRLDQVWRISVSALTGLADLEQVEEE